MFRKIYLTAILGLFSVIAFAQTGTLKGIITDRSTGDPVSFANVIIEKNGNQSGGTSTDINGNFTIKPLMQAVDSRKKFSIYKVILIL